MSNPRNALTSVLDVLGVVGGTVYSHAAFRGTGAPKLRPAATALALLFCCMAGGGLSPAPALAALPDNRAYEMVSPVVKGGVSYMPDLAVAAVNGEHVIVDGGAANSLLSSGNSWMLESRTATGWSGVQVGPPPGSGTEENGGVQRSTGLAGVSEDFSSVAFQLFIGLDPRDRNSSPGERTLVRGQPAEDVPSADVYIRRSPTEPFTWASGPPAPIVKTAELPQPECAFEGAYCALNNAVFAGGSSDLSTVVWSQVNPLVAPPASLPGSPTDTHQHGDEVYESTNGANQRLLGLVPASGSECGPAPGSCVAPPCGAAMGNATGPTEFLQEPFRLGSSFAPTEGAVSGDGLQVLFTSPEPAVEGDPGCHPGEIYLRQGATTVQVSASHRTNGKDEPAPDPHGPRPKLYAGAAQEAGKINTVFFTSSEELTNSANTGSEDQGNDLYAYNVAKPVGERLTDLTPDSNRADANGASVVAFIDASTDGSIVYFTATGVLSSEPNSQGAKAQGGASNLYVYDANTGTTRFVAPGNGIEGVRSAGKDFSAAGGVTSQATPDGRHLVFRSSEHITSDDKLSPACPPTNEFGEPTGPAGLCAEVYLYDQPGNRVVCVSCDPSGAPPTSSAVLPAEMEIGRNVPASTPYTVPVPRFVSDSGERVFFNSSDQLTPDAPPPSPSKAHLVNNMRGDSCQFECNAYEYENGHVYLIAPAAGVVAATPSGNDVFFYSYAQLAPQDRDGTVDIYDARVGGGFPALAAPVCSGASCQGAPAPAPVFAVPPSATFNGVGNFPAPQVPKSKSKAKPKACKRGFVRKKTRCVRKPKSKKAARSNRRGH
jgi:hypothetical protein